MDFFEKEDIILNYLNKASSHTYVKLFEYMNMIEISQPKQKHKNQWSWLNNIKSGSDVTPFEVIKSENDEINVGKKVTWTYIMDYIKNLAEYGTEDDILHAYDWVMENCKQKEI